MRMRSSRRALGLSASKIIRQEGLHFAEKNARQFISLVRVCLRPM